ncbi:MAG: hypothetical protein NWE98_02525 [Candidatus Bathyarchaeota archaeon]|nr:hypothetical protein [Candidatus Bathyarchaeota archaeon]
MAKILASIRARWVEIQCSWGLFWAKENEKLSEGWAARHLNSVGLSPTEIAKILGKKSRTQVSAYLYAKSKESRQPTEQEQASGGEEK